MEVKFTYYTNKGYFYKNVRTIKFKTQFLMSFILVDWYLLIVNINM